MENIYELNVLNYSKHHVHAAITTGDSQRWVLIIIYEHSETKKRSETWDLLKSLKPTCDTPWLLFGDFNEIIHYDEKWDET